MLKTLYDGSWIKWAVFFSLIAAVAILIYLLLPILTALFCSFLVAYVLKPIVDFGERCHIPRNVVVVILLILILSSALLLPLYVVSNLVYEATVFGRRMYEEATQVPIEPILDELPLRELVEFLGWAPEGSSDFDAQVIITTNIKAILREHAIQIIREYGMYVANMGREASRSLVQLLSLIGGGLLSAITFAINLSLFALVSFYLLLDYASFISKIRELIPPRYHHSLEFYMTKIDVQLRSVLRGQLTVCVALAIMYGIGFHWADTPFALPLALFGGAASIIPYIGPLLTLAPATLLTLLFYGLNSNVFWVFAVFVVVQIVETYFLTPRVLGKRMGLNPVWVIIAFMVFSSAFGFIGLLLSVPIAAVLKVLIEEVYKAYKKTSFYIDDASLSVSASLPSGNSSCSTSPTSSGMSGNRPA